MSAAGMATAARCRSAQLRGVPLHADAGADPHLHFLSQVEREDTWPGWGHMPLGSTGPTHAATEDISILRAIPGMTVMCPADAGIGGRLSWPPRSTGAGIYQPRHGVPQVHGPDYRLRSAKPYPCAPRDGTWRSWPTGSWWAGPWRPRTAAHGGHQVQVRSSTPSSQLTGSRSSGWPGRPEPGYRGGEQHLRRAGRRRGGGAGRGDARPPSCGWASGLLRRHWLPG